MAGVAQSGERQIVALEVAGSKLVARPIFIQGNLTLGCRQAVRHGILIPAFVGSNPATPAKTNLQVNATHGKTVFILTAYQPTTAH